MESKTIKFNVQGDERKELACAISRILNTAVHYAGAPTFNYEVGEYVIDKNGVVVVTETAVPEELQSLVEQLNAEGFEAVQEAESNEANRTQAALSDESDYGYTLVLNKGDDFTTTAECNLRRILSDKGYLIKKALNADTLDLEVAENELIFPWWNKLPSPDEIEAYSSFITAIVKTAKVQSRINAVGRQAENEKYAFRCFLLRLGFIGESFKQTRKILLKRLSGNSAFKSKTG